MRQEKTNTWKDGLNLDLHPMVTPNTVLTDCLNGTFITYNGNEFCLQNNRGNTDTEARLSEGFYPLGIKEHNGVLYIVSINNENVVEIGTYPGLNWNISLENIGDLNYKLYSPLYNLFELESIPVEIWDLSLTEPSVLLPPVQAYLEELGFSLQQILDFSTCTAPLEFDDEDDCSNCRETLNDTYNLSTIKDSHEEYREETVRVEFRTSVFNFDKNHPVTIEIQDSYDGSVNLIMTDGIHIPRIVNSGFSVLPNNKYKLIERNQTVDTNTYTAEILDKATALIQGSTAMTKIDLNSVDVTGQLKGGNYTFYLKYGNEDGNTTDLIAQSGIVSIFKGIGSLSNIRGTLGEERTNKSINFRISNLDQGYGCFYLYYSREYCDTQGYSMYECKAISKPYKYSSDTINITITGFEEINSISEEELNVTFHQVGSVKTIAQQQDMLFLGNITNSSIIKNLKKISYKLIITPTSKEIKTKYVDGESIANLSEEDSAQGYTDPQNIYYSLGYWRSEYYRFGVIYILSDGSITDVFNVVGFTGNVQNNSEGINNLENFIDGFWSNDDKTFNKFGVISIYGDNSVEYDSNNYDNIYGLNFEFESSAKAELNNLGVVGYQIVRQKRIPNIYCQGLTLFTDRKIGIPAIPVRDTNLGLWSIRGLTESFITSNGNFSDQSLTDYSGWDYINTNTYCIRNLWLFYRDASVPESIMGQIYQDRPLAVQSALIDSVYTVMENYTTYRFNSDLIYLIKVNFSGVYTWYVTDNNSIYHVKGAHRGVISHISNRQFGLDSEILELYLISRTYRNLSDYRHDFTSLHLVPIQYGFNGGLCIDAIIIPEIRNLFNGDDFIINFEKRYDSLDNYNCTFFPIKSNEAIPSSIKRPVVFIDSKTTSKLITYDSDSFLYSTIVGNPSDKSFGRVWAVGMSEDEYNNMYNSVKNTALVRGKFVPFLAIPDIQTIGLFDISRESKSITDEILIRAQDNSPFYVVSNRISIDTNADIYRGDCYICRPILRYHYNFIDSLSPTANILLKDNWYDQVYNLGSNKTFNDVDWSEINLSDMNNVPQGLWIAYKCRSSYNLELRSIDDSDTVSTANMGNPRSFYPYQPQSLLNQFKQEESWLQNDGYNKTVSRKRYEIVPDVPYIKSEYSNRVMFSNKNVNDGFINGYRTYQGLAYHDYDKQYGEIVKLLPWDNNLFCVFEHGCAILPINEKALMQTTTDQTIHIYGHGVLPDTMTIISSDYGSKFPDTVIRTPIGIYGLDCDAKKVWRFSKNNGFETLSDMKIESWLNDNIKSSYLIDVTEPINVRTEYNSLKGDVIISIHDKNSNVNSYHSITFNERQNLWVTKNNWGPVITENANGMMYSLPSGQEPGIYKHDSKANPTEWYGQIEPFEFEFVVSDPIGVHKIIDNLQIISNNCQPEELTFEIIGDSYMFNKEKLKHLGRGYNDDLSSTDNMRNNSDILNKDPDPNFPSKMDTINRDKSSLYSRYIKNTSKHKVFSDTQYECDDIDTASFDMNSRTKEYHLRIPQECRNIETWGRRIGNIYYSEDSWYTNVEPIRFDAELLSKNPSTISGVIREARIRDKWCKIRVRYTGEDLAVISAIKTMINI